MERNARPDQDTSPVLKERVRQIEQKARNLVLQNLDDHVYTGDRKQDPTDFRFRIIDGMHVGHQDPSGKITLQGEVPSWQTEDNTAFEKRLNNLGHYDLNNGFVMAVDSNGCLIWGKATQDNIRILNAAGHTRGGELGGVPFSSGEIPITDTGQIVLMTTYDIPDGKIPSTITV